MRLVAGTDIGELHPIEQHSRLIGAAAPDADIRLNASSSPFPYVQLRGQPHGFLCCCIRHHRSGRNVHNQGASLNRSIHIELVGRNYYRIKQYCLPEAVVLYLSYSREGKKGGYK